LSEIPVGLKKRWEEFGDLSRKCWTKVKAEEGSTEQQFERFWNCMKTGDPVSSAEVEECAAIGHPLAPHPICVIAKTAKGMMAGQAVDECLREGQVHGISKLACEAAKRGEL